MNGPVVGKGVDRVDARLKVTGQAQYAAEVPVANLVHAVIVTAPHAKGRVESVDTQAAAAARGVLTVLTPWTAAKLPGAARKAEPNERVLQVLQARELDYGDQPIAVVVAVTLEQAQGAAELLKMRYSEADVHVTLADELAHGYAPKNAGPREPADSSRGDVDAGLGRADVRVEATYTTPIQHHNPMEMHGLTAVWHGPDALTLYDTNQGIFAERERIAAVFEIPVDKVRVISRYVGGGFGCKGSVWSHVALAALAARTVERSVRLVLTRQQMFSLVGYRPRTIQTLKLGASRAGKLLAMQHDVVSETSRIDEFGEPAALQTRMLYSCANVATSHRLVRLDVPTPTFTRAPGYAPGTFALEVAMDELAYALELDPLELRLRNYAERDEDKNLPFSSKSLRQCYQQAGREFGWARRQHAPRSQRDGHLLVGWGLGTAVYHARQSPAAAAIKVDRDGRVLVQSGTQDLGTGTYTILSQIAADALGVPLSQVRFELGDTALPETPISGGSQTAATAGSAVHMAALELRKQLVTLAGSEQRFAQQSLAEVMKQSPTPELSVRLKTETKADSKGYSGYSFGAQFVEVTVDEDLGEVRVRRAVSAFAAGRILNAKTARSQFLGGMVWGIGFALHEHSVRDPRSGRVVTRDLADYHVPVNADVPQLQVLMVDEKDEHVGHIGAKGIGEIGVTGIVAAIANAIHHATGKRLRDVPITLDKLL